MGGLDATTRLIWRITHLLACTGGSTDLTSLQEGRSMVAAFLHATRTLEGLRVTQTGADMDSLTARKVRGHLVSAWGRLNGNC